MTPGSKERGKELPSIPSSTSDSIVTIDSEIIVALVAGPPNTSPSSHSQYLTSERTNRDGAKPNHLPASTITDEREEDEDSAETDLPASIITDERGEEDGAEPDPSASAIITDEERRREEDPFRMIPQELEMTFDGAQDIRTSLDEMIAELVSLDEEQEAREATARKHPGDCAPDDLLQTDLTVGLTEADVVARTRTYGLNQLPEEKSNYLKKLGMYFVGPIQFAMEAAALLALGLKKWMDFGIIGGLLLLNAGVGFLQDYQAGNIVEELKKTLANKCRIVRDGIVVEIESIYLVPGDIVLLEEGSVVPADGRLRLVTEQPHIQVDQSAVTGESMALSKNVDEILYQSSTIKRGAARMVVVATGPHTFVGRSATLVNEASAGRGHFTEVVNKIGMALLALVAMTQLVVFVTSLSRAMPGVAMLEFALMITVVGVPVGLPAVVTTTMAVGASYLAKKKAIVKRLSAIESLAGVEILCSDKTGTLTKNKLSLGKPYSAKGVNQNDLMLTACLTCSKKATGLDPIDRAILKSLKTHRIAAQTVRQFHVIQFTPFNPVDKKAVAVVETPNGEKITCVKGAPFSILKMVTDNSIVDPPSLHEYRAVVDDFARRGFRSLGVARKRQNRPWEILGVIPCLDPPRKDTEQTIKEARKLGLKVKMLTGDAVGIAVETSRQLGLGTNILTSEGLDQTPTDFLPTSSRFDFIETADGFAEIYPQHKYNVVDILQQRGYLVAMTGDGVNDAPSLKRADTGIAVEGASNAARSAADIVFLEPGLSAIIDAVKTSRQIFHRMRAYIAYRIALSVHMLVFMGVHMVAYNDSIDTTLVVFLAIFADLATLAIAYDRAPYSSVPVHWDLPRLWAVSVVLGLVLAAGTTVLLVIILNAAGTGRLGGETERRSPAKASALLFLQVALSGNWTIFVTRHAGSGSSGGGRPGKDGSNQNRWPSWQLVLAVLLIDGLATVLTYYNWFASGNEVRPHPLQIGEVWVYSGFVLAVVVCGFWIVEFFGLGLGAGERERDREGMRERGKGSRAWWRRSKDTGGGGGKGGGSGSEDGGDWGKRDGDMKMKKGCVDV